jgi:hypothetical protein
MMSILEGSAERRRSRRVGGELVFVPPFTIHDTLPLLPWNDQLDETHREDTQGEGENTT